MNKVMMMAFGSGQDTTVENVGFKKYIGVGTCNVVAINPSKKELEDLYGTQFDKEPEYIGKDPEGRDQIRIEFITKTAPEKNSGVSFTGRVSFFLKKAPRYNNAETKVQVVNKYGEFAYINIDAAKKGEVPEEMKWFVGPYRPAFIGEEDLTGFLKTYLGIPSRSFRDANGVQHDLENLELAEAQLEDIKNYFTGNIKELRTILAQQPDNQIKICFGVKSTDDNKEYQDVFTRSFARGNARNLSKLAAAIENAQSNGAYSRTVFSMNPVTEYVVTETTFQNNKTTAPAETEPAASLESFF